MIIGLNTKIRYSDERPAVKNAVEILERDIAKCFNRSDTAANEIILEKKGGFADEDFMLTVTDDGMIISADDELGFVYGLLYISKEFLGIQPFWFWMDQRIKKRDSINVEIGEYRPKKPKVQYRGWFINDEVLIMKWAVDGDYELPWKMAFEALLRCGGNIVIPGTDKNSRLHRQLASDMGLWLTHHHAEPLGAEMFIRQYPGEAPNYFEHKAQFHKLWRDAVEEQKNMKVVWCLGFRGQGDCPFWSQDTSGRYDTDEKRGALISEIIELQKRMVLEKVKNPVFCTNLYGEVMELYDDGHISFDEEIIKVSADNGFGKMVTRRRDNHTARVLSMPDAPVEHGGIYYHVSFYDLQAANHITMLPNSVDFVNRELDEVNSMNMTDFWVINCSNIRPHTYFLDAVSRKWYGETISDKQQSKDFAADYYGGDAGAEECLREYHNAMIAYGAHADEHCGEQFYNENLRMLANHIIRGNVPKCGGMEWLTGDMPLDEQAQFFCRMCMRGLPRLKAYYDRCLEVSESLEGDIRKLFDSTILLQARIHYHCCSGADLFGKGCEHYKNKDMFRAFMVFGDAAEEFDAANMAMRGSEYGVWKGFYFNECFADCKHTAYMIKKLMGIAREYGDNARHDKWYREIMYAPEDRGVMTLLVNDNHMEDNELYIAAKKRIGKGQYKLPIENWKK
ncbi:MAG: glycosyl hydrolase 115 family protein [Clostridia bacterium]|nr:glycosyl hydrolase 115 family protein [Clostridia bacterium]